MSGVWKNVMSLLCAGVPPPSAFIVASIEFVSNAALFHSAACASSARSQPAAATSVSSVMPPPVRNAFLRCKFMDLLPFEPYILLRTLAREPNLAALAYDYFEPLRIHCTRVLASASLSCGCAGIGIAPHAPLPPRLELGRRARPAAAASPA